MRSLMIGVIGVFISACTTPITPAPIEIKPISSATQVITTATASQPTMSTSATPASEPGVVPIDLLTAIRQDLAQSLNISIDSIEIAVGEAVIWSDGSLGCPQPGMAYTDALVPGYRVVLRAAGVDYFYSASQQSHFIRCEQAPDPMFYHYPDT